MSARRTSIRAIVNDLAKRGLPYRLIEEGGKTILEGLTANDSTASSGRNESEWEKALNAVSTGAVRSRGRR